MKKLLLALLLSVPSFAVAQTQSLKDLVGAKLKETKTGGSIGLDGKNGALVYLPVWSLRDSKGNGIAELINVGGEGREGERTHGFIGCSINPVWLSDRVWDFEWAKTHVVRTKLPPIYLGVGPILPLDLLDIRRMKLKESLRATLSVRFDATFAEE